MKNQSRIEKLGNREVLIDLKEREAIDLELNRFDHPQETVFDMHFALELGVVLSGKMRRVYHSWETTLATGEVWLGGSWELHGCQIIEAPCEVVVMVIDPQVLARQDWSEAPGFNWLTPFTVPPKKRPTVTDANRSEVISIAKRISEFAERTDSRSRIWKKLLVSELLMVLTEDWQVPEDRQEVFASNAYERLSRAIQQVFADPRPVTSSQAAKLCGLSRNHFSNLFQDLMGISFAKFSQRYRVNGAAKELLNSKEPVKNIATRWGFTDDSHLHRCFLNLYKCSPAQYRKKAKRGTGESENRGIGEF